MRLVIITYGTEGDARPLGALGRALMDAGHQVRLLGAEGTLYAAKALGVATTALAGDIRGGPDAGGEVADTVAKGGDFANTAQALARIANTNAEAWLRETVAAGQGCDAVIVSGMAAFVGLSAAEHLGVKAIGAGMIPITPTRAFASPFLPPAQVPGFLNRSSHALVNGLLWRAFRKAINAARAEVCGLPPRREGWTSHPMLYGVSPSLLPRPDDWPANAEVCGQWAPPSPDWSPPPALEAFLAAGEPPLYFGFGSMSGFDQGRMLDAIVGATAGRRALFYPGWSGIDPAALPGNFFILGDTPHAWLFPRTSVVVHHAGSGTSHSAVRAGAPSVTVPFAGDQFFWADRLYSAGVAPLPVKASRIDAGGLSRSLALAQSAAVTLRARELGVRAAAEDGLAHAVGAIERILAK